MPQYSNLVRYDQWFKRNVEAVLANEVLGPVSWHPTSEDDSSSVTPRTGTPFSPDVNTISDTPSKPSYSPHFGLGHHVYQNKKSEIFPKYGFPSYKHHVMKPFINIYGK